VTSRTSAAACEGYRGPVPRTGHKQTAWSLPGSPRAKQFRPRGPPQVTLDERRRRNDKQVSFGTVGNTAPSAYRKVGG